MALATRARPLLFGSDRDAAPLADQIQALLMLHYNKRHVASLRLIEPAFDWAQLAEDSDKIGYVCTHMRSVCR